MDSQTISRVFRILIPLNCFYILMAVLSASHSPQTVRFVPFYMLVVFLLNMFVWKYWGSSVLKRSPRWRRVVRLCVWIVLLVNVPMLALGAVEERSASLAAAMFSAALVSGVAFWVSNAELSK